MPSRSLLCHRRACRFELAAAALALAGFGRAQEAHADFAPPPESPYRQKDLNRSEVPPTDTRDNGLWEPPPAPEASTFRFHIGPAVLLQPAGPGLFTALDIGQHAVGVRASAAWLRAESEQGLAAYSGELWIDFRHRYELHPVLSAGASLLRGRALGQSTSVGAGVLRGALEYELPIADADARLGLNVQLFVPAIGSERTRPWTMAALTIGAGF